LFCEIIHDDKPVGSFEFCKSRRGLSIDRVRAVAATMYESRAEDRIAQLLKIKLQPLMHETQLNRGQHSENLICSNF